MISKEQVKKFTATLLDLQRDNFIELMHNPDFQSHDVERKEKAIHYITALFKKEIEDNLDSFIRTQQNSPIC